MEQIGHVTGCARSRLLEWCEQYQTAGLSGLREHRGGRRRAKLRLAQRAELEQQWRQDSPRAVLGKQTHTSSGQAWTVEDLAVALERWDGGRGASRSSYLPICAACHFTYQRTAKVDKSRRAAAVAAVEAPVDKS